MARALLLSLLVRQHLALQEKFRARYPHPWLVWEAGAWNVPEASGQNLAATQLPVDELRDCLPPGDALCFELAPGLERSTLTVGRASHNTLVINDATVSREHLVLHVGQQGPWRVEARPRASTVVLEGRRLEHGEPVALHSGARLELGDVRLTFHDSEGFHARIGHIAAQVLTREAPHAG